MDKAVPVLMTALHLSSHSHLWIRGQDPSFSCPCSGATSWASWRDTKG